MRSKISVDECVAWTQLYRNDLSTEDRSPLHIYTVLAVFGMFGRRWLLSHCCVSSFQMWNNNVGYAIYTTTMMSLHKYTNSKRHTESKRRRKQKSEQRKIVFMEEWTKERHDGKKSMSPFHSIFFFLCFFFVFVDLSLSLPERRKLENVVSAAVFFVLCLFCFSFSFVCSSIFRS